MSTTAVHCDYCRAAAKLVTGAAIYPHRPDLAHKRFWHCAPCDAFVGVHENSGNKPLGRLADATLRRAKSAAHVAFDPVWKSGGLKRRDAYRWLAGELGIPFPQCHIGMFDVAQCQATVRACERRKVQS